MPTKALKEYGPRPVRNPNKIKGFVMHFKTPEAKSLWENELRGQISDGMYENRASETTWQFWSNCETVADGTNAITKEGQTVKELPYGVQNGFGFKGLFEITGARMLSYILSAKLGFDDEKHADAFAYFEDVMKNKHLEGKKAVDVANMTLDDLLPNVSGGREDYRKKYIKILFDEYKTAGGILKAMKGANVTVEDYKAALKDVRATMTSVPKASSRY